MGHAENEPDPHVVGSGATLTENGCYSTYYEQEKSNNTKHLGADGFHDQGDYSYYGPYGGGFVTTSHRKLDADGFEQGNDSYGANELIYVDTNPDGGLGAGYRYYDDYGCLDEQSVTLDPTASDPLVIRLDCPYAE